MTAMAVTSITILGGCGKTTEDTVAPADTETEALTEETEEIETETETEESIMDANGNYKDFAEDYVTYTTIEEVEMYGIGSGNMWENPNMTKGELHVGGRVDIGSTFKVNATCEIDNTLYYRTAPNNRNQMFIIEADLLSDTPPADESNNENQDSQDNQSNNTTQNTDNDDGWDDIEMPSDMQGKEVPKWEDLEVHTPGDDFDWDEVTQEAIDNMWNKTM